jgi:hypothetical protein
LPDWKLIQFWVVQTMLVLIHGWKKVYSRDNDYMDYMDIILNNKNLPPHHPAPTSVDVRVYVWFTQWKGKNGIWYLQFSQRVSSASSLFMMSPLGKLKYVGTEGGWMRYAGIGLLGLRRDAPRWQQILEIIIDCGGYQNWEIYHWVT